MTDGLRKALEATAEDWRYKSEDLKAWQEGGGPSPDEAAFDDAAVTIRKLLADYPAPQSVVDREALALAWEEGWRRGVLDASESTDASATTNPYAVLDLINGTAK